MDKVTGIKGTGIRMKPRREAKTKLIPVERVSSKAPKKTSTADRQNKEINKAKVEEFCSTLKSARGKKLLICISGYPDPDNIATSLALQWCAHTHEIETKIIYFENISHHENRALVKKLDLELEQASSDFDASKYDYFAINDSQNTKLPIAIPDTC